MEKLPQTTNQPTPQTIVMAVSLAMAVVMLLGKMAAYWVSGSTSILSDAAESVIHGVATGFACYSLWLSQQPASQRHPYGHGKIAYFSAGFEGALIFCAGIFIIAVAIRDLIVGPELKDLGLGILITAALCLINLALGIALVRIGKQRNVLILVANGQHVLADMWTSAGVVIGVTIVWYTDILWLDPLVAIAVGANIGWTALGLLRKASQGLLDVADPESVNAVLTTLNDAIAEGTIAGFHQLRLRNSNDLVWVEVHLMLPAQLTVHQAHTRASEIEETIRGKFPNHQLHITTHVEPHPHDEGHPTGHSGLNDPFLDGKQ
jgi:cation diffusion facilitator family transporter